MVYPLKLHAESVCEPVTQIEVLVTRQDARLCVRYVVQGAIAALRIPGVVMPERADELWQHTCCEAFIGAEDGAYYEFNWSPGTRWAAYRFAGYRAGMVNAAVGAPLITQSRNAERFELQAIIDCKSLALPEKRWRIGITTVIEEMNGRKSYWALAHPSAKPDFHHPDGFIIELEK
jgi:hypothetical protein